MLSDEEHKALLAALGDWAERAPDVPVAGFLREGRLMTPRELATAAESEGPTGRAVLQILEHGVRREGLASVIERLRGADDDVGRLVGILRSVNETLGRPLYLLPGPTLRVGDVVRIEGREVTRVDNVASLLGVALEVSTSALSEVVDHRWVTMRLDHHVAGDTVEILFDTESSWFLGLDGYSDSSVDPVLLQQLLTEAYVHGIWHRDWALVHTVGTAEAGLFAAPKHPDAGLSIAVRDRLQRPESFLDHLHSGNATITRTEGVDLISFNRPRMITCSFLRLGGRWWRGGAAKRPGPLPVEDDIPELVEAQAEMLVAA